MSILAIARIKARIKQVNDFKYRGSYIESTEHDRTRYKCQNWNILVCFKPVN